MNWLLAPPSPHKYWNVRPYLRYWPTWYDGLARVARAVACRECHVECAEVTKSVIAEGTERVVGRQLASGKHRVTCAHRTSFVQGTNDRQSSLAQVLVEQIT